ncbi:MAG: S9 family peptidase [Gammaproteobacteria bacterium]|nr:S9 family peptidase [Gammaproteobacteria bacterium]
MNVCRYIRVSLLGLSILATTAFAGITPEDFAKNPEVLRARISPTGEYLAVMRLVDDQRVVAVLTYPDLELSGVMSFPGRNQVLNFWWVSDDRLIGSVTRDFGRYEFLAPSGELFGMNADGDRSKHLFGYRAGDSIGSTASRQATRRYASARILNRLWDDPDHVLVEIRNWTRGLSSPVEAARMNVFTGALSGRIRAPVTDAVLVADQHGNVRFAFSTDDRFNSVVHERDPTSRQWRLFSKTEYGEIGLDPLVVAPDGRIYVRTAPDDGPLGIYLLDAKTQQMETVYRHAFVDADLLTDHDDGAWGVFVEPDYPKIVTINGEHRYSILTEQLKDVFPGRFVRILNETHDGRLTMAAVTDDNATPEVYLFDREERSLRKLFDMLPWIDDGLLAEMRPIEIEARDGLRLRGYLTLPPPAIQGSNLPLVVMPHGGPHGPRDSWGFDPYVQVLATHGYAVLQINYRGSGGYGPGFERLGHRQWGKKMQDDVTDATLWAIDRGIADPKRICIYGWSYGGYAAMMGVIREPGLYACAVPAAGVYDQDIQYRKADFTRLTRWGDEYIDKVIGPTAEDRRLASPVTYVDRIETPLFLVHGEEDQRVPIGHAHALLKALKRVGISPQYMEKNNEGHGFFKEANRVDFFEALLKFLDRHIGDKSEIAAGR